VAILGLLIQVEKMKCKYANTNGFGKLLLKISAVIIFIRHNKHEF